MGMEMTRLCECGCGMNTLPYTKTAARIGAVKGQPARFIKGHSNRKGPLRAGSGVKDIKLDKADIELLEKYAWRIGAVDGKKEYAFTNIDGKTIYMHRLLMNAPKGMEVDHINADGLNNRRENLRLATRQENCRNTPKQINNASSRFKGVSWNKRAGAWESYITVDRKKITLGRFKDEHDAANAYNRAARKYFGEFAFLNDVTTKH